MKLKKKLLKGYKRGMKTLMPHLFGCDVHKESHQTMGHEYLPTGQKALSMISSHVALTPALKDTHFTIDKLIRTNDLS